MKTRLAIWYCCRFYLFILSYHPTLWRPSLLPQQHLPTLIVDIRSMGNRVYVSDVQEGVHFVRYKAAENQLIIFADETLPRSVRHDVCLHSILPGVCVGVVKEFCRISTLVIWSLVLPRPSQVFHCTGYTGLQHSGSC